MSSYNMSEPPSAGGVSEIKAYLRDQYEQLGVMMHSIDGENMTDEFITTLSSLQAQVSALQARIAELENKVALL